MKNVPSNETLTWGGVPDNGAIVKGQLKIAMFEYMVYIKCLRWNLKAYSEVLPWYPSFWIKLFEHFKKIPEIMPFFLLKEKIYLGTNRKVVVRK